MITLTAYLEKWIKNILLFLLLSIDDFTKRNEKFLKFYLDLSVEFLSKLNISVDDVKLFDEYEVLKEYCRNSDNIFFSESLTTQRCNFLKSKEVNGDITEFVKICQFVFVILAHNANVERMFSLVNAQWWKKSADYWISKSNINSKIKIRHFRYHRQASFYLHVVTLCGGQLSISFY